MITATTRLHITPLTPELLPAIIGPSLLEAAQNISYHHIQTCPENSYGYVDLPTMDAEKIKKKLNGATLKGKKIKVDEARPKKRKHTENTEPPEGDVDGLKTDKAPSKKRSKQGGDVIQGHEVSPERKIRRGWTEVNQGKSHKKGQTKSDRPASKYSDKEELLFRTKLPENRGDLQTQDKKKSKNSSAHHVVHEFEKSTSQPSFLKSDTRMGKERELQYVDGQGWVDDQGNVIEQESERSLRKRKVATEHSRINVQRSKPRPPSPNASSTSSGASFEDAVDEPNFSNPEVEDTSSSGSSDGSETSCESNPTTPRGQSTVTRSDGTSSEEVHPLEALFKKPHKPSSQDIAKPSLEVSTAFSFFEAAGEGDQEETNIPGTPFSSQDFRSRGLRSAAPTPDTAHPSRFNSYGSTGLPGDEDFEDSLDGDRLSEEFSVEAAMTPSQKGSRDDAQQSEFERKFWEQRGDNNRAWKARRRTVLKEKRQRDNRARRPKNW